MLAVPSTVSSLFFYLIQFSPSYQVSAPVDVIEAGTQSVNLARLIDRDSKLFLVQIPRFKAGFGVWIELDECSLRVEQRQPQPATSGLPIRFKFLSLEE